LVQTAGQVPCLVSKAVLEQPSPRRMLGEALGRRNIVLSQSDELNCEAEGCAEGNG
jgi:hypothetical protein